MFIGPRGAAVRETTFGTKIWRPTLAALGLSHLHFHDLRGFAATSAAISGATTAELMYRFGHATPDMALRYQRAIATRDAAIARDLNEQLRERARVQLKNEQTAKRPASSPADQDALPGL